MSREDYYKNYDQINYEDVRSLVKTGDIVLFSGKGHISNIVKWACRSYWSHVAMIIKHETLDMALLFESTTLNNVKDVESGTEKRGVQLTGLRERIMSHKGDVAIRMLSDSLQNWQLEKLGKFRSEMAGRDYERDMIELIKSAYDGPFGLNSEDLSSLFCSELVAETYQKMGLILDVDTGGLPSNEYTPKDFSSESDRKINFLGTQGLEPEIFVNKK